jgi:hypothetical protein
MTTEVVKELNASMLTDFARSEFKTATTARESAGQGSATDPWIIRIERSVLRMLEILDGLPGDDRSRWLASSLFGRLSQMQVITPLTGAEDEWHPADVEGKQQNTRCVHVFRRADGTSFDAHAVVLISDQNTPQGVEAREVSFPYMPRQEFVRAKTEDAAESPQSK